MNVNVNKYWEITHSEDRISTGMFDVNGEEIHVGDVIVPLGRKEKFYINYDSETKEFYGLAENNKQLKQNIFTPCKKVGIAIFNEDMKKIFTK